jgi:YHS domain-containing protein
MMRAVRQTGTHVDLDSGRKAMRLNDPVCGREMTIDEPAAVEPFAQSILYFCSQTCHGQFVAEPRRYVDPPEAMSGETAGEALTSGPARPWHEALS